MDDISLYVRPELMVVDDGKKILFRGWPVSLECVNEFVYIGRVKNGQQNCC